MDRSGLWWESADEIIEQMRRHKVRRIEPGDSGHPGDILKYEDGVLLLESDIFRCGEIGIAIATYQVPRSCGNKDFPTLPAGGLVVFFYSGDGIVRYQFWSFAQLQTSGGFQDFINTLLKAGASLLSIAAILAALVSYCGAVEDSLLWQSVLMTLFGAILAYLFPLLTPLEILFVLSQLGNGALWDKREDILNAMTQETLLELVKKREDKV